MKLFLDKNLEDSLYLQLYNSIKCQIVNGDIKPGDKLPSYRFLKMKYNLNLATITKAYSMLENAGIIEVIQGSGSYVKPITDRHFGVQSLIENCYKNGQTPDKDIRNLASNSPYIYTFPIDTFKKIIQSIPEEEMSQCFTYGNSNGNEYLCDEFIKYLESRRINCNGMGLQIVSGSQQGLNLVAKCVMKKDNVVVVEDPGYAAADNIFMQNGCKVISIPVDYDGLNLEEFKKLLKHTKVDFLYIMSNYQVPTTACYSDEKKIEIIELARKYGFTIIEDDCMSELTFEGNGHYPLASMDCKGNIIYIKSFSKIIMPGLRLGLVLIPEEIKEKMMVAKFYADITSSELMQVTLAKFFSMGYLDEHLKNVREVYLRRYMLAKEAIEKSDNLILPHKPDGGLFLWVKLNRALDAYKFYNEMYGKGVVLIPGNVYSHTGMHTDFLHISFSTIREDLIEESIGMIDSAINDTISVQG